MIPTGLQALIQASEVLSQEASPSAPGPQGPQPTVASQVAQQAQQVVPQLSNIGRQAGIAGQLMNQRLAQQQAISQNPEAIAQMAAQMMNRGVGALPVNMQFKQGGIIGYNGEDDSDVKRRYAEIAEERERGDQEAGLSLAERADKRLREKGGLYSGRPVYDPRLFDARAERAMDRELSSTYSPILEDVESRYAQPGLAQTIEKDRPIPSVIPAIVETAKNLVPSGTFEDYSRAGRIANLLEGYSDTEKGLMDQQRAILASQRQQAAPPRGDQQTPPPAGAKPTGVETVLPGAVPRAELPTAKSIKDILASIPEDAEAKNRIAGIEAARRNILEARKGQQSLEDQGIGALEQAKFRREALLKSRREDDTFNRLIALFRDLRTKGTNVQTVENAINAREDAAIQANLLHDEAVIKYKQAKQAREIGNLEAEANLLKESSDAYNRERAFRAELAKQGVELEKAGISARSTEAIHYADRVASLHKLAIELKEKAGERNEANLRSVLVSAAGQLANAHKKIEDALEKDFGPYILMRRAPGAKIDPNSKEEREYQDAKASMYDTIIAPLEATIASAQKKLGIETPAPSGKTIDFSSLAPRR